MGRPSLVHSIAKVCSLIKIIIRKVNILKNVATINDVTVLFFSIFSCATNIWTLYDERVLVSASVQIGEKRIGASLQRLDPSQHYTRQQQMHRVTNPVPYCAEYFEEKLYIDQNENWSCWCNPYLCHQWV